jgi:hypothetical protein
VYFERFTLGRLLHISGTVKRLGSPGRAGGLLRGIYRLEEWHQKALQGIETALKAREGDPLTAELDAAMRRIGEITMENELLREKARRAHPLGFRRSKK